MTKNRVYVPILKCKKGEQKALQNLDKNVKDMVIPLIEIPFSSTTTKKENIGDIITSFWPDHRFFFYFMPEWYDNDLEQFSSFASAKVTTLCKKYKGIPVIDLSLAYNLNNWEFLNNNEIAIRLRNNEFGDIENILNPLFNGTLERSKTHLILDLQYISQDDIFAKTAVLKAIFSDLDKASDFASIIIASTSFPRPNQLTSIENQQIYRFKRIETDIFALSLKLANRFNFNYVYSDYGPSDISDIPFVIGMSPNFKIKYTAFEDYLYIKGISLKKGGLDIANVQSLAKILVENKDFSGSNYSWGDKEIYRLATGESVNPGNLTTWVSYSMNHHITFISHQI